MKKDLQKGYVWIEKAALAGLPIAQYSVAVALHNGDGVNRNYKQSLYWLQKAASQGYAPAKTKLNAAKTLAVGSRISRT